MQLKENWRSKLKIKTNFFRIYNQSCDKADRVPSREANVKCPQTVIKCYEELSTWHTAQDGEDVNFIRLTLLMLMEYMDVIFFIIIIIFSCHVDTLAACTKSTCVTPHLS